jgi:hypothetical protein
MQKEFLGLAVALLMSLSAHAQNWAPLEPPIEVTPRWETQEIIVHFNQGVRPAQIEVNGETFGVTRWERVIRRKKLSLPKAHSVTILISWDQDGVRGTYRVLLFNPTPG